MATLGARFKSDGDKLFDGEKWSKALNKYRQAAKYAPDDSDLWVDMYDFTHIIAWLVDLLELTSTVHDSAACCLELQLYVGITIIDHNYILTFEAWRNLFRYEDVISSARRAIEINSLNAAAWGYLAAAYQKLEQWITCFEAYDNALNILRHQDPPNDRLKDQLHLSYADAKKQAKLRRVDGVKHLFSGLNPGEQPWERAVGAKQVFERTHTKSDSGVTSAVRL